MAIIKCKMCGGNLNIIDGSRVAECEYCGSLQTVFGQDNTKQMNLMERANRFRSACEFDRARSVYEAVAAEFPEEAEAYWGLVLCEYGIEYVDDPATGKKIPTCHRSSYESLFDNKDYQKVIQNAEPEAKQVYQTEAEQIDAIRQKIIDVSRKEQPYDVFICYKETDDSGKRTKDSVIAQDIYFHLKEQGLRVFFSRISLENVVGKQYEPYIFAALNSAKVMIVLGTKPAYVNAVWVKNEWKRFLKSMEKNRGKVLLPCYRDMSPYDLPEELNILQSYDMGRIGFLQDLSRGISRILDTGENDNATESHTSQSAESSGEENMVTRGFISLEDGEWEKADRFFEDALNLNAKNSRAYLGKLLIELRIKRPKDLIHSSVAFFDYNNYKRAMRYADDRTSAELEGYANAFIGEQRRKKIEATYQQARSKLANIKTIEELEELKHTLKGIEDYKDSKKLIEHCDQEISRIRANEQDAVYMEAVRLLNSADSSASPITVCNQAKNMFLSISAWKDSAQKADSIDIKILELSERQARLDESRMRAAKRAYSKLYYNWAIQCIISLILGIVAAFVTREPENVIVVVIFALFFIIPEVIITLPTIHYILKRKRIAIVISKIIKILLIVVIALFGLTAVAFLTSDSSDVSAGISLISVAIGYGIGLHNIIKAEKMVKTNNS